ncbi:hypothetical protein BH20ACT21_BH20ACT21_24890 [soil metagenome]
MSGDVWYLDTSAFVKLIQAESESDALQTWLFERRYASSDLLRPEAIRVARRAGTDVLARCRHALGALTLVRIDAAVFESAAELDPAVLRTLDALHLAAARLLGDDLAGIVTYDRRMTEAGTRLGLEVTSPGMAI